jgi:prevent-host-death family protein
MVNVHEAKSSLSDLLRRVEAGEEIIIARAGTPAARLVQVERGPAPGRKSRRLGIFTDQIHVTDEFDEIDDDWLTLVNEGPLDSA